MPYDSMLLADLAPWVSALPIWVCIGTVPASLAFVFSKYVTKSVKMRVGLSLMVFCLAAGMILDRDLLTLIVLAAIALLLVAYFQTVRMSHPERMIHSLSGPEFDLCVGRIQHFAPWIASVGLNFLVSFRFGQIKCLVYQQQNVPRYFTFLFQGDKLNFDLQAFFQDGNSVETGTTGSAGMLPCPKNYQQSFPNLSPEEALQRQLEGEAYFINTRGFVLTPPSKPFTDLMLDEIRSRIAFSRSQPFWVFRQFYRFFVTRFRIRNRTVAERYPVEE